jgi:dTDP-4-dehydrorhamnose reductase
MTKVLILGASGMLGAAVSAEFANANFELTLTSRPESQNVLPAVGKHLIFDAKTDAVDSLQLQNFDYVLNCIGIIKPRIHDDNQAEREGAILVNSLFPSRLAAAAEKAEVKVIQIATDCVFSGEQGGYSESSPHDPVDVYGKTKSLGETPSSATMHLRVSTIGPEQGRSTLLLEWVRQQPQNARISGYTDHLWNGITTKAFAQIARGILRAGNFKSGVQHILPANQITKSELVQLIASKFGRNDIDVDTVRSGKPVNRTLTTNDSEFNVQLWANAGHKAVPTIEQLLTEIAG